MAITKVYRERLGKHMYEARCRRGERYYNRSFPTLKEATKFVETVKSGGEVPVADSRGGGVPHPSRTKVPAAALWRHVVSYMNLNELSEDKFRVQGGINGDRMSILKDKRGRVSFDLADKIICTVIGNPFIWHVDPKLGYQTVDLKWLDNNGTRKRKNKVTTETTTVEYRIKINP